VRTMAQKSSNSGFCPKLWNIHTGTSLGEYRF
jgi:hypothetical protein